MSVKTVEYLANAPTASAAATPNTERGPSEIIWGAPGSYNAWPPDFYQEPRLGLYFFDDFNNIGGFPAAATAASLSIGNWSLYAGSNAGPLTDAAIVGGVIQFVPSSGTVSTGASNTQVTLNSQIGAYQIITNSSGNSALQGRLAFEARVALTSVTSGQRDAFIGLADQGAPSSNNPFTVVSAGSSQMLTTTRNLIGFYNADSGRGQDWAFVFQLASTAPVFSAGLQSLVSTVLGSAIGAGTYYKLGFVYDPFAPTLIVATAGQGQTVGAIAKAMIKVYVNGVQCATFLTQTQNILTASFPTGIMGPCISFANVSNSGTSNSATNLAGLMNVDWVRVAQNLIA